MSYFYRLAFSLLCIITIGGCSKQEPADLLLGTWQLDMTTVGLAESEVFNIVSSEKSITLSADGTFTSVGDICLFSVEGIGGASGSWGADEAVLALEACVRSLPYELSDGKLIIDYRCADGCRHVYVKQ